MSVDRLATAPKLQLATRREDAVVTLLTTWLIGGLFLDGYAHVHILETETEDFFTIWHGILYASFLAICGWLTLVAYRRASPSPIRSWLPAGYQASAIGVVVFGIGGIGDGIWHTIYGVEIGIDALLSPTHLLLFFGILLLLWTPVRSASCRQDQRPLLPVVAAGLTSALLIFFTSYLVTLTNPGLAQQRFDPATADNWAAVTVLLGSVVVQVAVLAGPLLMVSQRWRLPLGTATALWAGAILLEVLAFGSDSVGVAAAFIGGLTFDVTYRLAPARHRVLAAFSLGPAAIFASYLVLANANQEPEIWGGIIAIAGFVGAGMVGLQSSGRHALVDSTPSPDVAEPI